MSQDIKQHWSKREIYLGVISIVVTVVLCIAAIYYKDDLMSIANMASYSLLGMLIIAFLAGSILSFTAIPVPYWILVFTLPSVLAPQWGILAPVGVGITSALGTTLGHIPTFLIGYGGSSLSRRVTRKYEIPFYNKAVEWAQKHGAWAAFAMSAMFNPAHLPMTIAIGALRFPPPKFILFSFLGNAVKSLSLAFAGYFGLSSLLHFLGGVRENSMMYFAWFLVSGICLGVGGWQLAVWLGEIRDKNKKYRAARAYAIKRNKPLLVVGGVWGNKRARHLLKMPAHGSGDVCIDIDSRAIGNHPCGVIANVTHIPFSDKSFGAVFASHLLEHLPTVDDAQKALAELNRTAEAVFIAYPSRQSIAAWVIPDHHLWVWQKDSTIYLKQRGKQELVVRRDMLNQAGENLPDEDKLPEAGNITKQLEETGDDIVLQKEASYLAQQLFGNNIKKCASFTNRLLDICTRAKNKDFLLIHNPGGFGGTPLEECLHWERSIVEGVSATIERLGYSWLLTQHLRSGSSWWSHMLDMKEQLRLLIKGKSSKTSVMVAELEFITGHIDNLKIILIAASQGAAFSNMVMRQLGELRQVYSIELGLFFPHMSRRVVTERTLSIDSNGIVPDPMAHRNLRAGFKAYITAPSRWLKYRLQGKPEKFTYCINTPGHDYNWEYPEVQRQIIDFLETNFSTKSNPEVGIP